MTDITHWQADPCGFIETVLYNPETRQPFVLLAAERAFLQHAFKLGPNGRLLYPEMLYSCPKKSGKTTFAALMILVVVLLYGGHFAEAYALANDQEQAQSRVFTMVRRIIEASPLLKHEARITQDKITFPGIDATVVAIASDAGSAAGSNAAICTFDELWAFVQERARRLWDEMTPPPTRKIACRLTVTYAGYQGESRLLEELYKRGLQQPLVGTDLYAGDGLLMFWSHVPIAPWQDEPWLASMRHERASAYQRMVLNEFASSESQFIALADWDACVQPSLTPTRDRIPIWVGVDASTKRDSTALVSVTFDKKTNCVRLVTHKVFTPTPGDPIDFEQTVERTLLDWRQRYIMRQVLFDPFQMASTAQRLTKAHVPIEEFPQTIANLTATTSNLFDLIQARTLVLYPDAAMRLAVSRAIVTESARGFKLDKTKQHHHIDVVVALSMACLAAVRSAGEPGYDLFAPGLFDDEPQEPSWAERERQRHYDDLLQRYGQPVSLSPIPPEYVERAKAAELLPAPVREAMQRARADALRQRNGGEA